MGTRVLTEHIAESIAEAFPLFPYCVAGMATKSGPIVLVRFFGTLSNEEKLWLSHYCISVLAPGRQILFVTDAEIGGKLTIVEGVQRIGDLFRS